jgi:hypothetical protein
LSEALLGEKALAACLAYLDLNPVRAKMAEIPESSEYTSIADRVASSRGVEKSAIPPKKPE